MSENSLAPIYLLADSQLLFSTEEENRFIDSIRGTVNDPLAPCAYIGASNGDEPAFYSIFEAAMESLGFRDCRMILSQLSQDDAAFVSRARIILLAGGDVEKGWRTFEENGLKQIITRRFTEGALLIGVSAGAVQLGQLGVTTGQSMNRYFETFKLVPFIVGVHEEGEEWEGLKASVQNQNGKQGIGIPFGGGAIYHPDGAIEPIRYPLCEVFMQDRIKQSLLFPKPMADVINAESVC